MRHLWDIYDFALISSARLLKATICHVTTMKKLALTFGSIIAASSSIWTLHYEASKNLEDEVHDAAFVATLDKQLRNPLLTTGATRAEEVEGLHQSNREDPHIKWNRTIKISTETRNASASVSTRTPNSVLLLNKEEEQNWDQKELSRAELRKFRSYASVDHTSCCGLGHRLSKIADAHYVSRLLNVSLRLFWGFCDDIDVAHFLFKPQPPWQMPPNITSFRKSIQFRNEVPGFGKLVREGPNATCKCTQDKYLADVDFYKGMRERFRFQDKVENFRKKTFTNHTVIGMHVRAGNNETGHFEKKNRGIRDLDSWLQNMVKHVQELGSLAPAEYPPLLYIATDTQSILTSFQEALKGIMPVVEYPQQRAKEGGGVIFGAQGDVSSEGRGCLLGWVNAMVDMSLLSHADVVVAARPSSFVQTMPMFLAFAQSPGTRVYDRPFCEVNGNASDVRCFKDFMEWCCESFGAFFFHPLNQTSDYIRVPDGIEHREYKFRRRPRDRPGKAFKPCQPTREVRARRCLAYDYPEQEERVRGMTWIR